MADRELLLERLKRLAIVLDELMPQCAELVRDAISLLKEQEDDYKNILSDYEDLARKHEKLLDKKIPLITNGQEVVRCKDCKHRPKKPDWETYEDGGDIEFPDGKCPCQCSSDRYYSWYPDDNWFCADGEAKT